jgi:hypothetical protein
MTLLLTETGVLVLRVTLEHFINGFIELLGVLLRFVGQGILRHASPQDLLSPSVLGIVHRRVLSRGETGDQKKRRQSRN